MASPHAAGVAALIVSKYGYPTRARRLDAAPRSSRDPAATATKTPCPKPPAFTYTRLLPTGSTVTATHSARALQQRVLRQRHRQRPPGGRSLKPVPRDFFREFSRDLYFGGLWTITYTTRGDTP